MQRELDSPSDVGLLEVEDTFKRLKSHKGVEGILIITKKGEHEFRLYAMYSDSSFKELQITIDFHSFTINMETSYCNRFRVTFYIK